MHTIYRLWIHWTYLAIQYLPATATDLILKPYYTHSTRHYTSKNQVTTLALSTPLVAGIYRYTMWLWCVRLRRSLQNIIFNIPPGLGRGTEVTTVI
jgi:hypothetical protein